MIRWTVEEERLLLELRAQGLTSSEIGRRLGRTDHAVRRRVHGLRSAGAEIPAPPPSRGGRPPSGEEIGADAVLRVAVPSGLLERSRVRAAEECRSLSSVVRDLLEGWVRPR